MKIIYEFEGGVSVMIPTKTYMDNLDDNLSELEKMEIVAKKDVPEGLSYEIVEDSEIPNDRTFRNAWELKDKKINISIEKAKNIKKSSLREEREILFKELDKQFMLAIEQNTSMDDIVREKQILRDITKEVDKVNTIEDLKLIKL